MKICAFDQVHILVTFSSVCTAKLLVLLESGPYSGVVLTVKWLQKRGFIIHVLDDITWSPFPITMPSGVKAGAGNVSQSASSQKSLHQSAAQTLTRRSALPASHSIGADTPRSCSVWKR